MSFQIFYKVGDYPGEGILFEKYKEEFGLYAAQKPRIGNGTIYKKWAYPQRRHENKNIPSEKAIPIGVKLGNQREVITILRDILKQLNG